MTIFGWISLSASSHHLPAGGRGGAVSPRLQVDLISFHSDEAKWRNCPTIALPLADR